MTAKMMTLKHNTQLTGTNMNQNYRAPNAFYIGPTPEAGFGYIAEAIGLVSQVVSMFGPRPKPPQFDLNIPPPPQPPPPVPTNWTPAIVIGGATIVILTLIMTSPKTRKRR